MSDAVAKIFDIIESVPQDVAKNVLSASLGRRHWHALTFLSKDRDALLLPYSQIDSENRFLWRIADKYAVFLATDDDLAIFTLASSVSPDCPWGYAQWGVILNGVDRDWPKV